MYWPIKVHNQRETSYVFDNRVQYKELDEADVLCTLAVIRDSSAVKQTTSPSNRTLRRCVIL